MGTFIGRIEREFILNNMQEKKIDIKVHGFKKACQGVILNLLDDYISIYSKETDWEDFKVGEEVRIFFSYYEHVMTFQSTIENVGECLNISYPESMYKNLQRKYERVLLPEGSKISFTTENTVYELTFPKTEEYDPVDKPSVYEDFDFTVISQLINDFKGKIEEKGFKHLIQMFRERGPNSYQEEIITKTGKILYIPSTSGEFPDDHFSIGGRLITKGTAVNQEYNKIMKYPIKSPNELSDLLLEKDKNGIKSEVYCPIIYQEYIVGYIYVFGEDNIKNKLDISVVEFVHQFTKVIAYSLKINGYFDGISHVKTDYAASVIDVSASGLLFMDPSIDLANNLVLYSDIDLELKIGHRKMKISSRVMRKYDGEFTHYYGVQFMDIKPEDFRFLFDEIYGREFTQEDETKWEGGADPPELNF